MLNFSNLKTEIYLLKPDLMKTLKPDENSWYEFKPMNMIWLDLIKFHPISTVVLLLHSSRVRSWAPVMACTEFLMFPSEVSSWFSGFLPLSKNTMVDGLVTLNCLEVWMLVWCPVMDWSPIQGVFPLNIQCSRDRLRIHRGPDRIKCSKMKMNEEIKS